MALIKPEVFSQVVREKIMGKAKLLGLGTKFSDLEDFRTVGETVNYTKWKYIGDATDLALGGEIATAELDQSNSTSIVKHVAKGAKILDASNATAIGEQIEEASEQLAISILRKMERDMTDILLNEAVLKVPVTNDDQLAFSDLINALALFGDEQDRELFSDGGILIHSSLMPSFYSMDAFVSKDSTLSSDGNGKNIKNGLFGFFLGIPVYVADLPTKKDGENVTYIIQNGAFGVKMKRDLLIEEARVASHKRTDIFADAMYTQHLLDESKLVILKKTIA